MLTQQYLLENLHYNPDSGIFTRIKGSGTAHTGDVAGTLSRGGYIYISLQNYSHRAHRLVWLYMYGALPTGMIDHVNGIRHDNRLSNLRECTRAQNSLNSKVDTRNKFGLKGVRKIGNRFCARATRDYKEIHLGCFATAEEASECYLNFVKLYSPDFARPY